MRFSQTIKLTGPDLVVSQRHEKWTAVPHAYTTRALLFAGQQLDSKDRVRKGTVSASSLGGCDREQQFTYMGMRKLPPDTQGMARMANGSFMHLRWQMEGLTAGWIKEAEVSVPSNPFRLSGTMDGILYDDSILELKSINSNGFSRIATFGPLLPHLYQMATYVLCTGRAKGVFLYENKNDQDYKEIVVKAEELPLREAEAKAVALWDAIDNKKLVEPLEDCIDRKGWKYNSCPFRDRCLGIHHWEQEA